MTMVYRIPRGDFEETDARLTKRRALLQAKLGRVRALSLFTWPGDKILMLSGRNVADPTPTLASDDEEDQ